MKQFELNQTYCKVLLTISELNKKSYYPLNEGIYKILVGALDDEISPFSDLSTFATLTSFSSKKICHLTLALFKAGLISKVFDPRTKKLYFTVTEKGDLALANYFKKHKKGFVRRSLKTNVTIVKID